MNPADSTMRPSGPNSFGPRIRAGIATSGSGLKGKRLARLALAARRVAMDAERRTLVQAIQAKAANEQWSNRETARRAGLSRTALARLLLRGRVDLEIWLPRLRDAATRVNLKLVAA